MFFQEIWRHCKLSQSHISYSRYTVLESGTNAECTMVDGCVNGAIEHFLTGHALVVERNLKPVCYCHEFSFNDTKHKPGVVIYLLKGIGVALMVHSKASLTGGHGVRVLNLLIRICNFPADIIIASSFVMRYPFLLPPLRARALRSSFCYVPRSPLLWVVGANGGHKDLNIHPRS